MKISFFVDAVPIAQPRQRHRISGKGPKAFVQNYTPEKHPVQSFKQVAQFRARQAANFTPGLLLAGPLRVSLTFLMPRPQRLIWKTKPMPRVWAPTKPDRDNLEKAIFDALKGIVWVDDAQVCDGTSQKFYAAGGEAPGVCVGIETLE